MYYNYEYGTDFFRTKIRSYAGQMGTVAGTEHEESCAPTRIVGSRNLKKLLFVMPPEICCTFDITYFKKSNPVQV